MPEISMVEQHVEHDAGLLDVKGNRTKDILCTVNSDCMIDGLLQCCRYQSTRCEAGCGERAPESQCGGKCGLADPCCYYYAQKCHDVPCNDPGWSSTALLEG